MIAIRVRILIALLAISLAAGCSKSGDIDTALTIQTLQPTNSPQPPAITDTVSIDPTSVCPAARGVGTVPPAVSIYSITFLVNGIEQVVLENNGLQAVTGDEVQIREVIICAGSFSGDGGQACVDFTFTDENGQEIMSEHKGTHILPVTPGFVTFSDLSYSWTVSENWSGFYAVLNHWPSVETQDLGCADRLCERDDWVTIEFH